MKFFKILSLMTLSFYAHASFAGLAWEVQMQNFIDAWRVQNQVPAVVVSIRMPDGTLENFDSGTLTLNGTTAASPENLFGIGSITKTFVAATMLQLQQEHKLKLDDAIGPYFPEYPRWSKITIRQLLNMTSGIVNYTDTPGFKDFLAQNKNISQTPATMIAMAYQMPDYFKPGHGWHYSNTNYLLAGLIIEKVTQHTLADELQTRFFTPLKLKHTYYSATQFTPAVQAQMAHGYYNDTDETLNTPSILGAAGGMVMNSQDLITWTRALFIPGKLLSAKSLGELETIIPCPPAPLKPHGAAYGLGVYSLHIPKLGLVWWYTGVSFQGYSSVFMWIPSKNMIIVAQINRWQGNDYGALMPGQEFMQKVLAVLFPKSSP